MFLVKKCANWLQAARTANGGGVGWQHTCAMQTNMVPLNFFSIVAPMPVYVANFNKSINRDLNDKNKTPQPFTSIFYIVI